MHQFPYKLKILNKLKLQRKVPNPFQPRFFFIFLISDTMILFMCSTKFLFTKTENSVTSQGEACRDVPCGGRGGNKAESCF